MAQWREVARGTSFADLESTVGQMELTKGTKVKVVMETWAPWVFDIAGAELIFKPFIPEGLDLLDVYGESGKGIVEMEADPIWLIAMVAFMKAHWLAIIIGGFILATIISLIVVMVKVPAIAAIPIVLIVGAALGIVGITLLASRSPPRRIG
ncbi:hypothetical protein LCGC14_0655080 [marine sediment metagenome]|uniref:Uncharacterized protein n=1 Tax=marine sediment metagenome TaxID=412755 RepID=A0A0F9TH08_9ZZZZ